MNLSVEIEVDSKLGFDPPDLDQLTEQVKRATAANLAAQNNRTYRSCLEVVRVEIPRAIQHLDIR